MTEAERRNLKIITDVCEAFNRHDAGFIMGHFHEDGVWLTSRGAPPEGHRLSGKAERSSLSIADSPKRRC